MITSLKFTWGGLVTLTLIGFAYVSVMVDGHQHSMAGQSKMRPQENSNSSTKGVYILVEDENGEHEEFLAPDDEDETDDEKIASRKCQFHDHTTEEELEIENRRLLEISKEDAFIDAMLHYDEIQKNPGDHRRRILNSDTEVVTFPVIFHIIEGNNAASRISMQVIEAQMEQLNKGFAGGEYANAPDSYIRFVLKQVKRYSNNNWFNNCFDSGVRRTIRQQTMPSTPSERARTLSVWTCNPSGGVLGWVDQLPSERPANDLFHGVFLHFQALTPRGSYVPLSSKYNEGDTLTHEVGHFLGLHHIFHSPGQCNNGDGISDTPDQRLPYNGGQCNLQRFSCSTSVADMITNYMDYSDDVCLRQFTPNQIAHMRAQIRQNKRAVYNMRNDDFDFVVPTAPPTPVPTQPPQHQACINIQNVNNLNNRRKRCKNNSNCEWDHPRCNTKQVLPTPKPTPQPTPIPNSAGFEAQACINIQNVNQLATRRKRCNRNDQCTWRHPKCHTKVVEESPDPTDTEENEAVNDQISDSPQNCGDLPGNPVSTNNGNSVCGIVSNQVLGPHFQGNFNCESTKLTYDQALSLCESAGFRLCTAAEIDAGAIRQASQSTNGCNQAQNSAVWTNQDCGFGERGVMNGTGGNFRCRPVTSTMGPACCLNA